MSRKPWFISERQRVGGVARHFLEQRVPLSDHRETRGTQQARHPLQYIQLGALHIDLDQVGLAVNQVVDWNHRHLD